MTTLVEKLNEAGIAASEYRRGPLGKDSFAVGVRRGIPGEIKVWEGLSDIDVRLSKKHSQAVLNVEEMTRRIKETFELRAGNKQMLTVPARDWTGFFNVRFPRTPIFTIDKKSIEKISNPILAGQQPLWKIDVTASVPASRQSLLVGMDESANFVALLREPFVESVREAHRLLRPERAYGKNAKRQGEWFFVPISGEELEAVKEKATKPWAIYSNRLELESSHFAHQIVTVDHQRYVMGFVTDNRRGHHQNLLLEDWHRVVRNRERTAPRPVRSRYWD